MIRALIAGGTGFIGKKLTNALAARGWLVTVLTQDVEGSRSKLHESVRIAGWDPKASVGSWTDEIEGVDTVINLAGEGLFEQPWTKDRMVELRSSRVDLTRRLATVIAQAKKKPKLFISASAVGIYGMRKDDESLGEDGSLGTDALAEMCKAWERAAGPAQEAGVRVVHSRTGIVLGADGGALAKMLPPFKWGVGGPLGDGKQWVSWVHWKDLVDAFTFVHDKKDVTGPFNMTAPNPVTMADLAKGIALVLHTSSRFRVPPFALRMALGDGPAEAILTGQRALPKKLTQAGFEWSYPDLVPALENLIGPK